MRNILFSMVLMGFSSFAMAGGSIGGVSGGSGLALEIGKAEISPTQFSRLLISKLNQEKLTVNNMPARLMSVDFDKQIVTIDVDGIEQILPTNPDLEK